MILPTAVRQIILSKNYQNSCGLLLKNRAILSNPLRYHNQNHSYSTTTTTTTKPSENAITTAETLQPEEPSIEYEDVDRIQEASIPLHTAIHLAKSVSIGHEACKLSLNILCKTSDAAVRDLRGAVILPHRFLDTKVCVISSDPVKRQQALKSGASTVGGEELIEKIRNDLIEMDRLIITPEILPLITPLARQLGPRGIMPTQKKGTITDDIEMAMQQQADAVLFKCDHNGMISAVIGKTVMAKQEIVENITEFIEKLKSMKKGKQKKFVSNVWLEMDIVRPGTHIYIDKSEFKC